MSEALSTLLRSYGIPVVAALSVSGFSVIVLALFMAHARTAGLLFVVVVLCSINPSYGFLETVDFSVYSKGTRTFFFPFIQYYLYGLFLATFLENRFRGRIVLKGAGQGWMLAFAAMFAFHVAYGLATGVSLASLLSNGGLLNVLHMSMIVYVTVSVMRDKKSLMLFTKILLSIVVLRGCYALVRFLFFGGDPQNAYANLSAMDLKITFWDNSEGLLASLVTYYCARRLSNGWGALPIATRVFFAATIVVEVLVILLSYRRTNWYGLVLAGSYFVWRLPRGKRAVAAVIFVLLMLPSVVYLSTQRSEEASRNFNLSLMERIAPDVHAESGITARVSRFYELYRAFDTIVKSPVVGVGVWGEFEVGASAAGLEYHQGQYGFVHSGFGHVLLKSGVIGLILFCGILSSAWRFAGRAGCHLPEEDLALFESCRAGLLFLVPDLLFGTPIIAFRTMALLGVLLAVPVAISRIARSREPQPISTSGPAIAPATRPFIPS